MRSAYRPEVEKLIAMYKKKVDAEISTEKAFPEGTHESIVRFFHFQYNPPTQRPQQ